MKNKYVAALLAFFLGGFGIHKFYLGQSGAGALYFLFSWTAIPIVIGVIDGLTYLFQSQLTFDQKFNHSAGTYYQNTSLDDIQTLAVLYERGHISKEEFEQKKTIILNKIR